MRLVLALTCTVLVTAAAAAGAGTGTSTTAPLYVLAGGGWGHGVGMSQWGALGQAREGRTYDEILATYYQGTELAATTVSKVRVLLLPAARSVRIGSAVPFRVRSADGTVTELPAGVADLDRKLRLLANGERLPLQGPVRVLPGAGAPLQLAGKRYRGELRVSVVAGSLQVVNVLGLEAYLVGVVPGEVPKDWPLEALKAQAVAARTYAVVGLLRGKPYDLYADVRSQVYYGLDAEATSTTAAVKATRGQIVTYEGEPAQTLYFSSSGGATRSAVDIFGNDLPYLVGVDDPWDAVPENPNHAWAPRTLTGKQLADALKLPSPVVDASYTPGAPGRPATMRFVTKTGPGLVERVSDLRWRLGLRSSSFRIGVLRLQAPPMRASSGDRVALTGLARDVEEPLLERRVGAGPWTRAARVKPRPDGTFAVVVRPATTTTYRLSTAGLAGPSLTLSVAEAQ